MLLLVVPEIAILAGVLLPVLSFLKTTDAIILFYTAFGTGVMGSLLLFLARLPLYRQRDFGLLVQANRQTFTANFTGWLMQ